MNDKGNKITPENMDLYVQLIRVAIYGHEKTEQAALLQKKIDIRFADSLGLTPLEYYLDVGSDYSSYNRMVEDCKSEKYDVVIFHSVTCLGNMKSEVDQRFFNIRKLPRSVNWWFVIDELSTNDKNYMVNICLAYSCYSAESEIKQRKVEYLHDLNRFLSSKEADIRHGDCSDDSHSEEPIHTALYIKATNVAKAEKERLYYLHFAASRHYVVDEVYIDYGKSKLALRKMKSDAEKGNYNIIIFHGFSCFNHNFGEINDFIMDMLALPNPVHCVFDLEKICAKDDSYKSALAWEGMMFSFRERKKERKLNYRKCDSGYIRYSKAKLLDIARIETKLEFEDC